MTFAFDGFNSARNLIYIFFIFFCGPILTIDTWKQSTFWKIQMLVIRPPWPQLWRHQYRPNKHNTELQRKPPPANQYNILYIRCIILHSITIVRYTMILHLWRHQMTSSVSIWNDRVAVNTQERLLSFIINFFQASTLSQKSKTRIGWLYTYLKEAVFVAARRCACYKHLSSVNLISKLLITIKTW